MNIRQATIDDLSPLATLFDAYRVFYRKSSDLEAAKSFLKERIQNHESTIYLAEVNDEIVGFTQLYPSFSSTRMKRMWILNDLYVATSHRGNGVAKALLDRAKQLAIENKSSSVLLETELSNEKANRLYLKESFILEQNNFYSWDNDQL